MSMISEQLDELRAVGEGYWQNNEIRRIARQAANTIEELSAKLAAANMERSTAYYNGGWIPCSEDTPKIAGWYLAHVQHERKDFITIEKCVWKQIKNGRWRWYRIGNGCEVVAWMPLPEPYNPNICGNTDCPHNNGNYCPAWNGCGGYQSKEEENT